MRLPGIGVARAAHGTMQAGTGSGQTKSRRTGDPTGPRASILLRPSAARPWFACAMRGLEPAIPGREPPGSSAAGRGRPPGAVREPRCPAAGSGQHNASIGARRQGGGRACPDRPYPADAAPAGPGQNPRARPERHFTHRSRPADRGSSHLHHETASDPLALLLAALFGPDAGEHRDLSRAVAVRRPLSRHRTPAARSGDACLFPGLGAGPWHGGLRRPGARRLLVLEPAPQPADRAAGALADARRPAGVRVCTLLGLRADWTAPPGAAAGASPPRSARCARRWVAWDRGSLPEQASSATSPGGQRARFPLAGTAGARGAVRPVRAHLTLRPGRNGGRGVGRRRSGGGRGPAGLQSGAAARGGSRSGSRVRGAGRPRRSRWPPRSRRRSGLEARSKPRITAPGIRRGCGRTGTAIS